MDGNGRVRPRTMDFEGQGEKAPGTFADAEYAARVEAVRGVMRGLDLEAALFTSYHNVCWLTDFMQCRFGRRYGLVVTHDAATTVAAAIDGGQPWRRSRGGCVTYTDWARDNFLHAVSVLLPGVRRLGVERDDVDLVLRDRLADALPGAAMLDLGDPVMRLRMRKSPAEVAHVAAMCEVADLGGLACRDAAMPGVPEHEVAQHATTAMVREIARRWPEAELMDSWTWFQSGPNTDGAHNPVTSRRIEAGDVLSLNCFPMVGGYYTALERTMFCRHADEASLGIWQANCAVFERGRELLRPGARCSQIAAELNALCAELGLLRYRSFGYGHSFGVLCHYYGREAALELREDCDTVLEPGMVVSMEPMVTIPQGEPGAGGYREHDVLAIEEGGARNLTGFPYGPSHLIVP